jgi:hypothetical protein
MGPLLLFRSRRRSGFDTRAGARSNHEQRETFHDRLRRSVSLAAFAPWRVPQQLFLTRVTGNNASRRLTIDDRCRCAATSMDEAGTSFNDSYQ